MSRLRGWLMLGAALVVGALAALTARAWMRSRVAAEVRRTADASAGRGAPVVAAARDVARAARLVAEDLVLLRMPEGASLPGAAHAIEQVVGRVSRARLYPGEPLLEAKLEPVNGRPGLESSIPDGLRAMTVKADDVIGLSGFALPGSRVDVVAVIKAARADDPMARLVLQDIEVLATDQGVDAADGKPRPAATITLLVAPRDAERLALAVLQGHLQLMLRAPGDRGTASTSGVDFSGLLSTPAPKPARVAKREPKAAPAPIEVASATRNVELIENDRRQHMALERDPAGRSPRRRRSR